MSNSKATPGTGDRAIRNLTRMLRQMSPRGRAQLIRFLEQASENPLVTEHNRRRAERYLFALKDILRFEQLIERACEEFRRQG
jgi:hypothetical protein